MISVLVIWNEWPERNYRIHHCAPLVRFSHSVATEQLLWLGYDWGEDKFVFSDDDVDGHDHDAVKTHMLTMMKILRMMMWVLMMMITKMKMIMMLNDETHMPTQGMPPLVMTGPVATTKKID